jgi:endonuclease-3
MLIMKIARERFEDKNSQIVHFVANQQANLFLNNLREFPHAFVLACLMDRQIKAERAWMIPHQVCKILGHFDIEGLQTFDLPEYKRIFHDNKLHRFNDTMAEIFYLGVSDIANKYNGNASNIWGNNPSSASVVLRFLEFKGSGIKISTMAANILARQFRIPFLDYFSIDISPDVHIIRVMKRMGLVNSEASNEMIIYKARELNPTFPGIIDFSCWEIGKNWCRPTNPDCENCLIGTECKKSF